MNSLGTGDVLTGHRNVVALNQSLAERKETPKKSNSPADVGAHGAIHHADTALNQTADYQCDTCDCSACSINDLTCVLACGMRHADFT